MGSEMCIRDSRYRACPVRGVSGVVHLRPEAKRHRPGPFAAASDGSAACPAGNNSFGGGSVVSFIVGTLLLAVVTACACAVPGAFVVLRKHSMLIDAIGHAILPGIALGYLFTNNLNSPVVIVCAALAGVAVVPVSYTHLTLPTKRIV